MSRFRVPDWGREGTATLNALQGELNRLFEQYWRPEANASGPPPTDIEAAGWVPPLDLDVTPEALIVRIDLPGVEPGGVDLSLTGTVLSIRGERPAVVDGGVLPRVRERPVGVFTRSIELPEPVAFDKAEAHCKDGVLTVRLPKQEAARPRTIPIRPA